MRSQFMPSADDANQSLEEAELALDAASARLDRAADPIERGRAQIEVTFAKGARDRARRRVRAAELMALRDELEAACEAFTQQITGVYSPNSKIIIAAMATSWRLQRIVQRAERRGARVPRLSFPLASSDFCASLRLLNVGAGGLQGFLWYPGAPSEIEKIKAEDAVDLSRLRADSFFSGGEEGEAAAKAASEISIHVVVLYEHAAGKIAELLREEAQLEERLESWKAGAKDLSLLERPPATPLERVAARKSLWAATILPALYPRSEPIWARRGHGYALASGGLVHPGDVFVR